MKIIATTLGETAGDYISMSLGLGYYVGFAVTFAILTILLFFQIQSDRYRPALYWAAIIATTTAGTEVSDLMDRSFGLGYAVGSLILVAGLLSVLAIWYLLPRSRSERLSDHQERCRNHLLAGHCVLQQFGNGLW